MRCLGVISFLTSVTPGWASVFELAQRFGKVSAVRFLSVICFVFVNSDDLLKACACSKKFPETLVRCLPKVPSGGACRKDVDTTRIQPQEFWRGFRGETSRLCLFSVICDHGLCGRLRIGAAFRRSVFFFFRDFGWLSQGVRLFDLFTRDPVHCHFNDTTRIQSKRCPPLSWYTFQ